MKKLLSIILVGILAVSSFILTTFAAENEKSETEIEREKLGWLLDASGHRGDPLNQGLAPQHRIRDGRRRPSAGCAEDDEKQNEAHGGLF